MISDFKNINTLWMIGGDSMNYRYLYDGIDDQIKLVDGTYITPINFDNGATTPPLKSVTKIISDNIKNYGPIARGVGIKGEYCTTMFGQARKIILNFFGLGSSQSHTVVYTKSDTEGLNLLANVLIGLNLLYQTLYILQ